MIGNVRLKDIAEKAGVSIVTVSNALSGKKGVGKELRAKIIALANDMGMDFSNYRMKNTTDAMIGVLIPERLVSIGSSFYWELYQNTATAASKKHVFTTLELLNPNMCDTMQLPQIVSSGKADALIIIGKIDDEYLKKILQRVEAPVVLLDFYDGKYNCDAVLSCNYFGMYKATYYLISHGHKDIGFIGLTDRSNNIRERYLGYRKAMEEFDFPIRPQWVISDRDTLTQRPELELPEVLPTAFACSSDYAAGCLFERLMRRGLRVPEDISITGYDNYLYGNPFADDLTTYNVDMKTMGEKAVSTALDRIQHGFDQPRVLFIDSYMIERRSVKTLLLNR